MITYQAEGVKFPNIKKRETSNWIRQVAESYGKRIGEVGYMFVNDDKILEVNKEFLGHDYYTEDRMPADNPDVRHIRRWKSAPPWYPPSDR